MIGDLPPDVEALRWRMIHRCERAEHATEWSNHVPYPVPTLCRTCRESFDDAVAILTSHLVGGSLGVRMIAVERRRQIDVEGYTAEHDAGHDVEMAQAAACYAMPDRAHWLRHARKVPAAWPWERRYWKPTPEDRMCELIKAGALIAAAIDAIEVHDV